MSFTQVQVKNTKPGEKSIKLFDGHGLYLEIAPSRGRRRRIKYRFEGTESVYPHCGCTAAR